MNAIQLLADLRAQDIEITATGGKLRVSAPKGALTPSLETQLRLHKQELLDLLAPPTLPGLIVMLPERWIYPEICDLYETTPAEVWEQGVELFREGVGPVLFYSLEELQEATLPDTRLKLPERGEWVGGKG